MTSHVSLRGLPPPSLRGLKGRGNPQRMDCFTAFAMTSHVSLRGLPSPSLRGPQGRGNPQRLDCFTAFAMTSHVSLRGLLPPSLRGPKGRGNPQPLDCFTAFAMTSHVPLRGLLPPFLRGLPPPSLRGPKGRGNPPHVSRKPCVSTTHPKPKLFEFQIIIIIEIRFTKLNALRMMASTVGATPPSRRISICGCPIATKASLPQKGNEERYP